MTQTNGPAWKQTIYYPYLHALKYGRGIALQPVLYSTKHDTKEYTDVNDIESVAVYNAEVDEVTIFAVNRDLEDSIEFTCDIRSFEGYELIEHIIMENEDIKAANSHIFQAVSPKSIQDCKVDEGILTTILSKASWNVIRLGKLKKLK
jgi:alpha-N-arabinofuranosidase